MNQLVELEELAQIDLHAPMPSVATIQRRGRAIVRARRARRGAAVGGLAAALVVGGISLPRTSTGPGTASGVFLGVVPASAADAASCDSGRGGSVERAHWRAHPDVVAAASLVGGLGTPRSVGVQEDVGACAVVTPAAVLYETDPVRGLTVWRDVANPYGADARLADEPVRGSTGLLAELDDGEHVLSWRDDDGVRWLAEASGMSVASMVDALDALTFAGGLVDPASVPGPFRAAPAVPPTTSRTTRGWVVVYGGASGGADRVELSASRVAVPPEVAAARYARGVTFAEVSGATAVYTSHGGDGQLSWVHDRVAYTLTASGGLARLVALAERVEPVAVDDPRLDAVPDPRELTETGR